MRILMITHHLPYPSLSGGRVRAYQLLERIAQHHEVTLFSLTKTSYNECDVEHLRRYCKTVVVFPLSVPVGQQQALWSSMPLSVRTYSSRDMLLAVTRLVDS